MSNFDPELLKILVCPLSKATLLEHNGTLVSTDKSTRRSYSIIEGIPDLMIEHSRELSLSDWEQAIKAVGQV